MKAFILKCIQPIPDLWLVILTACTAIPYISAAIYMAWGAL